jgi:hypothetical protein
VDETSFQKRHEYVTVVSDLKNGRVLYVADDRNRESLDGFWALLKPEQLRAKAAISLGPVLEQADMDGFEDPDDVPITERTFRNIQDSLEKIYLDNSTPKEVRRRILEASVRAPETWHQDAIRHAYSSGDKEWMLTAVFSMRWVRGFDDQILLALKSGNPELQFQAVNAAGNWELDAAWSHIVELLNDAHSPKPLLLAAIGAVGSIRPAEAREILVDLADSDDEEIAEAIDEEAEGGSARRGAKGKTTRDGWINYGATLRRFKHRARRTVTPWVVKIPTETQDTRWPPWKRVRLRSDGWPGSLSAFTAYFAFLLRGMLGWR